MSINYRCMVCGPSEWEYGEEEKLGFPARVWNSGYMKCSINWLLLLLQLRVDCGHYILYDSGGTYHMNIQTPVW